jgi:DNA repair exonuclease SbcCD nuclease subunit
MPRQIKHARKADAILTADFHLGDGSPVCRDAAEFLTARERKMEWLRNLQVHHGCPIIDAGDVFDRWQVSSETEGWALLNLPPGIVTVPGNHDLPNHSLKLYKKSSLHVLEAAGKVTVLLRSDLLVEIGKNIVYGFPYGETFVERGYPDDGYVRGASYKEKERKIAVVHVYVGETVPPFIGEAGYTPAQLLAALPGYDLIVSGHNHQSFVYRTVDRRGNTRMVVNPGGMMRTTADQADMKPSAYLWYADTNTVEAAFYPIEPGVVSREHLEKKEERNERLDAFVSRLDTGVELGVSFERNIENHLDKNDIRGRTREMVMEVVNAEHK